MTLAGKLYFSDDQTGPSGRIAERRPLMADATLRDDASVPMDISVVDLSSSGCLIEGASDLVVPSLVTLGIAGIGRVPARIVRRDGSRYGCSFLLPLAEHVVAKAQALDTVVTFPAAALPRLVMFDETSMPDPARWPRPVRLLLLIGGAILTWAIVLYVLV